MKHQRKELARMLIRGTNKEEFTTFLAKMHRIAYKEWVVNKKKTKWYKFSSDKITKGDLNKIGIRTAELIIENLAH